MPGGLKRRHAEGRLLVAVGLVLLAGAVALLAGGGASASSTQTPVDLGVAAAGLALVTLGTFLIGFSRDSPFGGTPAGRLLAQTPSLAGAPALSGGSALGTYDEPVRPPRAHAASDTIAGQYAEAARRRTGRYTQYRLMDTAAEPTAPTTPYWGGPRKEPLGSPTGESGTRSGLADEVERLRARVAELESERTRRGPPTAPVWLEAGEALTCAGCGHPLSDGEAGRPCPSCGRPICAACFGAAPVGPDAHQCPDCRTSAPGGGTASAPASPGGAGRP